MIIGAHVMLQSKDRDADIAFFRDILKLPNVDAGEGYMLFGVPSSEVAVHAEGDGDDSKLYLMCDDVGAFIKEMEARGVAVSAAQDRGWGSLTEVTLPGGGALSVYQPHHPRPKTGGGKGKAGKGKAGKGRRAKGKNKAGGAAKRANLSPERQAKREERKKARAAAGGNAAAGGGRSAEEKKARQEQRKAKRAKKKASKGASSGGTAGEKS